MGSAARSLNRARVVTSFYPYGTSGPASITSGEGRDTVIFSEERSTLNIHGFSIADRNVGGDSYPGFDPALIPVRDSADPRVCSFP